MLGFVFLFGGFCTIISMDNSSYVELSPKKRRFPCEISLLLMLLKEAGREDYERFKKGQKQQAKEVEAKKNGDLWEEMNDWP